MRLLTKLKIKSRFIILVSIIIILLGGMNFISYQNFDNISKSIESLTEASNNALYAKGLQLLLLNIRVTFGSTEDFEEALDDAEIFFNAIRESIQMLNSVAEEKNDKTGIELLETFKNDFESFSQKSKALAQNPSDEPQNKDAESDDVENHLDQLSMKLEKMLRHYVNGLENNARTSAKNINLIKNVNMALSLVILVIMIVISWMIALSTIRPIHILQRMLEDIAEGEGDLTKRLEINSHDEIGEMAGWFNLFIEKLQGMIKETVNHTFRLFEATSDISAAVEEQVAVSTIQASSVTEITSTVEELTASSRQIAESSVTVLEIANQGLLNAETGSQSVKNTMKEMENIIQDGQQTSESIVELGKKSKEISSVMEIINSIADQTKLIAFNAALEASSAGEAGQRFGVVAVEIRRLADNVMESTGEISGKVHEIQGLINQLTITSENSAIEMHKGIQASSETVSILENILEGAKTNAGAAKQISISTQQQETASEQVVLALRGIMDASQQNSLAIQQTNDIVQNLTKLAENLKHLVSNFKVGDSSQQFEKKSLVPLIPLNDGEKYKPL